jgi:hypothetical protein
MGHKRKQKSRKSRQITKTEPLVQVGKLADTPSSIEPQQNSTAIMTWLTTAKTISIICILGLLVFSTGLKNPFENDDFSQIVNNPIVHSLSNIKLFFEGSTFYGYNPRLLTALYRPLMITVYAVIYSLFKLHSFYYHLFQLLLYIGCDILLFLVLKKPFKPVLALVLSLLFLVHPLNSQVAYVIPNLQDTLFFFFGILAFYLLFTFRSIRSLIPVVICLLLCMLSKETAICFVLMGIVYLFWWDKRRLLPFIGCLIVPTALYIFLRLHAVGLNHVETSISPIESISLPGRLMTIPAILLFYLSKLVFPWSLATAYFWTQTKFSIAHFLVPLIVDLLAIAFVVDQAQEISKKAGREEYKTFVFFAIWTGVGLVPYLQIIPVDGTVNEAWFYFSMAGVIGMLGTALIAYQVQTKYILAAGIVLICLLGVRTSLRGFDYRSTYSLAFKNVKASPDDFHDIADIAVYYSNKQDYPKAIQYLQRSVSIEPAYYNDYNLGVDQSLNHQYAAAEHSYAIALKEQPNYTSYQQIEENACITSLLTGTLKQGQKICETGINHFPKDVTLWTYLALVEEKFGQHDEALTNIHSGEQYGSIPPQFINEIEDNLPIKINFLYSGQDITIPVDSKKS